MIIKNFRINNFRNYEKENISFSDNINYILGDNAQGKTNLLEGIFFILNGESFKHSKEEELFNKNLNIDYLYLNLEIYHNNKSNFLELEKKEEKKIYKINSIKRKIKNNFIKTIIFIPDDLQIIKDGPAKRRDFLDREIKIIFSNYNDLLKKYNKIILQKNYVLKNNMDLSLIKTFNMQLAETGQEIIKYRLHYLKNITPLARSIYSELTDNKEILSINYKPSFNFKNYEEELEKSMKEEIVKKQSLTGIHRDDLIFYINDKPARNFASQGQQRSAILSLKIAELKYLRKYHNYYPILLLDDVFSELDEKRKNMLINVLKEERIQSFITLANSDLIRDLVKKEDKIIKIKNGKVMK